MKKVIVYLGLFVLCVSIGSERLDAAIVKQIENKPPYYLSFASIGAIFMESRLDAWAKINSDQQPDETLQTLIRNLKLPAENQWIKNKTRRGMNYKCVTGKETYYCTWEQGTSNQAYLLVSITSSDPNRSMENFRELLEKLSDYTWEFNTCYGGEIGSCFDADSMNVLLTTALINIKGQEKQRFVQGDSWTLEGYSPKLGGGLPSGSNVQIALRKEANYGKTRIWIGIPSVLGGY